MYVDLTLSVILHDTWKCRQVAGTSGGALVAASTACGVSPAKQMEVRGS